MTTPTRGSYRHNNQYRAPRLTAAIHGENVPIGGYLARCPRPAIVTQRD